MCVGMYMHGLIISCSNQSKGKVVMNLRRLTLSGNEQDPQRTRDWAGHAQLAMPELGRGSQSQQAAKARAGL